MYLKEEIQAEALTRNLAGFARFLPIAALFHGQSLNVSTLARDAGVARTTVQGCLQILEDTLFTFTVPAYEARLRVRERRHPKLYWVDPGLVRAVTGDRGPWTPNPRVVSSRGGSRSSYARTATIAGSATTSPSGRPPRATPRKSISCSGVAARSWRSR